MFKAPAVAYAATPTDFLVVRHATGRLTLREFQGSVAIGQQEPHMRVPAPQSKEKRCGILNPDPGCSTRGGGCTPEQGEAVRTNPAVKTSINTSIFGIHRTREQGDAR